MLLLPLGKGTRRGKRPEKREVARELLSISFAAFNPERERKEGRGTNRRRILSISFHHYT